MTAEDGRPVVLAYDGLSRLSRVLGRVSAGVVNHCERPVLVVPPGTAAASRGRRRKAEAAPG